MRVLVTGGSGKLGKFVVGDLFHAGHEIISIDRVLTDAAGERLHYRVVDLTDVGQIAGAMEGCDAVVHLGAIPNPYGYPDEVVFANNTQATFSVLQAARLCGIKRAAIASSVSAYGAAWSPTPLYPRYAPVDEAHPMDNHDAYGLSKEVDERTAEMFCRLTGMQIAALRFHWVGTPDELKDFQPDGIDEYGSRAKILWGYVDARDAAAACRLAIETEFGGFQAFNITASDTLSTVPTMELLATYLPDTEIGSIIPGTGSGYSISKAAQLLGWHPRIHWSEV